MKLEKLSKGYFKKFIIILVVVSIFGVIFINKSKAKYRVTQSIQVVSGEVNYKVPDLNVLAMYKQKTEGNTDDNNYESITDVPTSGYKVNAAKSYCTIVGNDNQLKDIPMEYKDGRVSISINKKGTKCYVYLDIDVQKTVTDLLTEIPKNHPNQGTPNFANMSCSSGCDDTTLGLFEAQDDFGTSYYFRGSVDYNWIKFGKVGNADIWWRIIRFNGNNTIRLIYAGTSTTSDAPAQTGASTQIGTSTFNSSRDYAKYVKYMYDTTKNSTIKQNLDTWFVNTSNLNVETQFQHIDTETGFCNDGIETTSQMKFPPYNRLYTTKVPSLKCDQSNLFTKTGSKGNNRLAYPVGLITVDEVSFAGGATGKNNQNFYLCTNRNYWTMSPGSSTGAFPDVFVLLSYGLIHVVNVDDATNGIRPVINLKADTQFKPDGDGTKTNPYEVVV